MTAIFTEENAARLKVYLESCCIPSGLGTKEAACSIAAINLAINGRLTDVIPPCMSLVIGEWMIRVQDSMPDKMRNSDEWKALLPLAAGSGRDKEPQRHDIVLDWMWAVVLPYFLVIAERNGFEAEWRTMLDEKTDTSADAASNAAYSVAIDPGDDVDIDDVYMAAAAAADAARAAAANTFVFAAKVTASIAVIVSAYADNEAVWDTLNPCKVLKDLIEV